MTMTVVFEYISFVWYLYLYVLLLKVV